MTAPLAFLSLALLWCQVGYIEPDVSRPLGGILWLIAVFLSAQDRKWLWLLLSAILLFNPWGAVHRGEGLYLLALLPWAGGLGGRRWMGAAWLSACGGWIWANSPGLWASFDEFAAGASRWLTSANLSSPAAGLPLLGLALCFPLAAILSERRLYANLTAIGGMILAILLFWRLERGLELLLHRLGIHGIHDAFNMQWLLLILLGVVLVAWSVWHPPAPREASRRRSWALVPALIFIGAVLVGWPPHVGSPNRNQQVIFYNKGYLSWDTPVYGIYGRHAGGMFGLAPEYLRWRGFNVVKEDTLSPEVLDSAGVVVIINLMDSLSAPEEGALHRFVNSGGSLLLLGDHTGLANIREPSNRALKPYGIELNFDSAKPLRTGWAGSLACAEHPLLAGLHADRLDPTGNDAATQIWIGASLKVTPPAVPLIVGRDGFSDIGNEKNAKDGFLGDFRYTINERLGNQVLLAQARAGKGKVLVFGDTSTLQNGALVRAGDWVARMFDWLLAPVTGPSGFWKAVGMILLLGGIAVWVFSGANVVGLGLGAAVLFVGAALCENRMAATLSPHEPVWTAQAQERALLDFSHGPRAVPNQVSADGLWGLQNCLMRSGFLPQVMLKWDEKKLADAKILIEMAPAKSFTHHQQAAVKSFMEKGGLVILCCGMEEFDGAKSLLKSCGLQPVYVPLGPAQIKTTVSLPVVGDSLDGLQDRELNVQFHEAWEVKSANSSARTMLTGYEKPLVVFAPVGRGGLLYLPDTDFLLNRNLESPSEDPKEENILFLRYLLKDLAGGK